MGRSVWYTFELEDTDAAFVEALRLVSPKQHALLVAAHRADQPSYVQLAEELGLPQGTVKSRLHRARAKILKWRKNAAQGVDVYEFG